MILCLCCNLFKNSATRLLVSPCVVQICESSAQLCPPSPHMPFRMRGNLIILVVRREVFDERRIFLFVIFLLEKYYRNNLMLLSVSPFFLSHEVHTVRRLSLSLGRRDVVAPCLMSLQLHSLKCKQGKRIDASSCFSNLFSISYRVPVLRTTKKMSDWCLKFGSSAVTLPFGDPNSDFCASVNDPLWDWRLFSRNHCNKIRCISFERSFRCQLTCSWVAASASWLCCRSDPWVAWFLSHPKCSETRE